MIWTQTTLDRVVPSSCALRGGQLDDLRQRDAHQTYAVGQAFGLTIASCLHRDDAGLRDQGRGHEPFTLIIPWITTSNIALARTHAIRRDADRAKAQPRHARGGRGAAASPGSLRPALARPHHSDFGIYSYVLRFTLAVVLTIPTPLWICGSAAGCRRIGPCLPPILFSFAIAGHASVAHRWLAD